MHPAITAAAFTAASLQPLLDAALSSPANEEDLLLSAGLLWAAAQVGVSLPATKLLLATQAFCFESVCFAELN